MRKTLTPLIAEGDLADDAMRQVRIAGKEAIAVYRVEGKCYATQDTCSHALASLAGGWLMDYEVICPVHEGRFDIRDGQPLCFPVTEPLRTFPVDVVNNFICADLSGAKNE